MHIVNIPFLAGLKSNKMGAATVEIRPARAILFIFFVASIGADKARSQGGSA
jgi:hypothetical protein